MKKSQPVILAVLLLFAAILAEAKAPVQVLTVDRVTVSKSGSTLTIHTRGTVGTPKWTSPALKLVSSTRTELVYDFVAVPPTATVPQIVTAISAVTKWTGGMPLHVRVRAKTNEKTVDVPHAEEKQNAIPGKKITVVGKLTAGGVECQAMREDGTNTLYTLSGNLGTYKDGDRVRVVGTVADLSTCQQGTTIIVKSITKVP